MTQEHPRVMRIQVLRFLPDGRLLREPIRSLQERLPAPRATEAESGVGGESLWERSARCAHTPVGER